MKIGIIGSRGIPNEYGGFEQFAGYLSAGLVKKGWDVWVYSPHHHSYQGREYNGINLIHCYDPEKKAGPAGHFIYDLNCILDSRKRGFDILLQLGYTTSAIWNRLIDKKSVLITNPDGLEWQRNKYNRLVKLFLRHSEKLALNKSHYIVADSKVIQQRLLKRYKNKTLFIPYGADLFSNPGEHQIRQLNLTPKKYYLLASRMQPDNHPEEIIRGVKNSGTDLPLVVVGNVNNKFAKKLYKKYNSPSIRFMGGIYNQELLNNLRYYSTLYFHGHSAGGTNPSLIEAMAASARICAHNNPFNKEVLGSEADYFLTEKEITQIIQKDQLPKVWQTRITNNLKKTETIYSKQTIIDQYDSLFRQIVHQK
ncbi:MAG TPA: DUF1972 domain-containing protein [Mariniphaga anaerophila]|uniref:DUF1972 domain-containing protein n=1 Tax=Mariniphaga anaerophila TaxID=1484053 RepID=A0A831LUI5_9BACT|nr:DUF1972 domain-containing protein [Mariniphaga anaerophila]